MNKPLSRMEKELLRVYADCGMNAAEAGRRLFRAGANVWYHLNAIQKKTGKDPRNFWQLCELLGMRRPEKVDARSVYGIGDLISRSALLKRLHGVLNTVENEPVQTYANAIRSAMGEVRLAPGVDAAPVASSPICPVTRTPCTECKPGGPCAIQPRE